MKDIGLDESRLMNCTSWMKDVGNESSDASLKDSVFEVLLQEQSKKITEI